MNSRQEFRPLTELNQLQKCAGQTLEKKVPESIESGERSLEMHRLRQRYLELLHHYAKEDNEDILLEAYSLGRDAVRAELNLVSAADLHHKALHELALNGKNAVDCGKLLTAANVVYAEFISPFEMSYRGYRQASSAMQHVNEMLEDEIRRIAQSLHDEAGQFLACVHIALYDIGRQVSPEIKSRIDETQEMLDQLESELRLISHELRPRILEESGLSEAIAFLAKAVSMRTGLDVKISMNLSERPSSIVETTLYRCVQELLNNASRHADADHAVVRLFRHDGGLVCEVQDDGQGFDAREVFVRSGGEQLGLHGLLERVSSLDGNIAIDTAPGQGARIRIEIPQK